MSVAGHRNIVIDGWRGLSVALVIIGHLIGYRLKYMWPVAALDSLGAPFGTKSLAIVASLGELGVGLFFVISGYLITSLLVAEGQKRGDVSLKAFYIRRVFRIMPAFYLYLISVFVLGRLGLVSTTDGAMLRSSTYLCNLSGFSCTWWLAHTWSLAVEEQFYILWPVLFLLRQRLAVALALFVALLIGSAFVHELSSFCFIMLGVLAALEPRLKDALGRVNPAPWFAVLLVYPIFPPFAPLVLAKPFLVAAVFFSTLARPTFIGKALQTRALVKVGLVSYSLYLWQQVSLAPLEWGGGLTGAGVIQQFEPLVGLAFIPVAVASYFWVELPMVKVGHRLSSAVKRPQVALATSA